MSPASETPTTPDHADAATAAAAAGDAADDAAVDAPRCAIANLSLSRRQFLHGATVGAGALVLGVGLPTDDAAADDQDGDDWTPNIWLTIAVDGAVTIVAHRSEMGTGIRTSLPLVVADELEADWSKVTLEQAIGDPKYGSQNTDGSRSIRRFFVGMREAGASARMMLEAAAALTWGVPAFECEAKNHEVVHARSDRKLPFGDLVARARALKAPAKGRLVLKPRSKWRYIGKDGVSAIAPYDDRGIVSGTATYGIDARVDGMVYAAIARSPVLGGTPKAVTPGPALAVKGVKQVVEIPRFKGPHHFQALGGVAVIADSTWAALEGRRALEVEWELPAVNSGYESAAFRKALEETARQPGKVVARQVGDVDAALKTADKTLEAEYYTPMLAHASMEPPVALAHVTEKGCECWAPTQNPQAARDAVAKALGLKKEQVIVHVTLLGGGFGRKSKADFICEAALLSRELGKPVKVQWTREDDIRHDYYHTCAAMKLKAGIEGGKVTAWQGNSVFPSIVTTFAGPGVKLGSGLELGLGWIPFCHDIPNIRMENGEATAHVRIGWLRAVANVYHAFAIGSFTDEIAHALGKDPLEMFLELTGPPRKVDPNPRKTGPKEKGVGMEYHNHREPLAKFPIDTGRLADVTRLAAKQAGWGKPLPKGRGLGIAAHRSFLSYVAVVVEVEVSDSGELSIPRVDIAIDCGTIVNPDRVRSQMEGSVIFGVSLALMGKITAKDGAIVESNFHDYPVCRMHDSPREIHVHLTESSELPAGVGEPGVPPVAPAITNAIFAATGKRVRSLPILEHDLTAK